MCFSVCEKMQEHCKSLCHKKKLPFCLQNSVCVLITWFIQESQISGLPHPISLCTVFHSPFQSPFTERLCHESDCLECVFLYSMYVYKISFVLGKSIDSANTKLQKVPMQLRCNIAFDLKSLLFSSNLVLFEFLLMFSQFFILSKLL